MSGFINEHESHRPVFPLQRVAGTPRDASGLSATSRTILPIAITNGLDGDGLRPGEAGDYPRITHRRLGGMWRSVTVS
jgi:hypothetical protein